MTVTSTVSAASCTVPNLALCSALYKMWLSVTPGVPITPLEGRHKACKAEQAARVPSRKGRVLEGELKPDLKPCPVLTLLSLDTGTSQHLMCKTQKRQGDPMKHRSDSTVTSSRYSMKKSVLQESGRDSFGPVLF